MPRTLVVIGHPIAGSYNHALAERYVAGLRALSPETDEHEVRIADLAAQPFPHDPASKAQVRAPEGDSSHLDDRIAGWVEDLQWADHLVFFFPQWWGTYPAVLKAFLDRVMLSGVAFRYGRGHVSERLLGGTTARVFMTMDSPALWNTLVYRNAAETSLTRATLTFCGVKTIGLTRFAKVRFSTPEKREAWLDTAERLGSKDAGLRHRRLAREFAEDLAG
ncbi:NAD(P)H-dependent oxidoreductase [Cellulomonas soli]|uniref:NAD(P)H-dependent oxidoreductase n=1 Tax=Cellulomonas soli TaxID=931535 RepID=UPI003F8732A5